MDPITRHPLRLHDRDAAWNELNVGDGHTVAHFFHANGFAFAAYRSLLTALSHELRFVGLDMRPLWPGMGPPARSVRWRDHGSDLIDALQARQTGPVLGIGHSMGATATVFAAARRPDLFTAIVLIEPAFVTRLITTWAPLVPHALRRLTEPGRSTLTRRAHWPDRDAFFANYQGRGLFRAVPSSVLREFAEAVLVDDERGGVRLAFSRQWEAHHYMYPASIWPELSQVTVPVLAIHGDDSVFLTARSWRSWKRRHTDHILVDMPGRGHLVPFEDPAAVAAIVRRELPSLVSNQP